MKIDGQQKIYLKGMQSKKKDRINGKQIVDDKIDRYLPCYGDG